MTTLSEFLMAVDEEVQAQAESARGGIHRVPWLFRDTISEDPLGELLPEIQAAARARRAKTEQERKRKARHTKGINKGMR